MIEIFVLVVAGYGVLVGFLYLNQRNILFVPSRETPNVVAAGVPEMVPISVRTADGLDLLSWYAEAAPGRPTLVYFHGNAGHIGMRGFKVRPFLDAGFGVMLVEYRGYGGNPGRPTEEGLYADGRAALDALKARGVSGDLLVLYGESLGTGVAVQMALEKAENGSPVGALVLEAPLSSAAHVGAYHYPYMPVRWLLKDRFASIEKIAEVEAPLLILHGDADRVVPERFGRAVFDEAREPKQGVWIAGGGHSDLFDYEAADRVLDFINLHAPR